MQTLLFTARRYASVVNAVVVCLSVCPSDTSRHCTKMAKCRIAETTPHDFPGTLVFWRQRSRRNFDRGAKQRCGRFNSAIFDQYLAISQKRCKIRTELLWNANMKSYFLY